MRKKVFIFDLDDTLMWNEYTYSLAFMNFYTFLMNLWGKRIPYMGSVAKRAEEITYDMVTEINSATGAPYGFTMERFPLSLVRTYQELCEKRFGTFDQAIADQVYEIGLTFCDPQNYAAQGLVPGAVDVLNFLNKQGDALILITKGDPRVQQRKIDALEVHRFFAEVTIVDNKTSETFSQYAARFPRHRFWSVGNSFYSDIQPAMQAGFGGIYIPCYTWKVEQLPDDYDKDAVITLQIIAELLPVYESGKLD